MRTKNTQSNILAFESNALQVIIRHLVRDLETETHTSAPTIPTNLAMTRTKGSYSSSINMNSANFLSFLASSAAWRDCPAAAAALIPAALVLALVPAVAANCVPEVDAGVDATLCCVPALDDDASGAGTGVCAWTGVYADETG